MVLFYVHVVKRDAEEGEEGEDLCRLRGGEKILSRDLLCFTSRNIDDVVPADG